MRESYVYIGIILLLFILSILVVTYSVVGSAVSQVNITINSNAVINFTVNLVDFGSGTIDSGKSSAIIDTRGAVIDGNWTPVNQGFTLENMGNTNLSVYIRSNFNASEFLGGTNPQYYYMISNSEKNSCAVPGVPFSTWIPVNNLGLGDKVCDVLRAQSTNNSLDLDLRLVIPSDALLGQRIDVFTALGVSS